MTTWRVVHEPGAIAPWIVQLSTSGPFGEPAWLDWRRWYDEVDARRYAAVASADRARKAGP